MRPTKRSHWGLAVFGIALILSLLVVNASGQCPGSNCPSVQLDNRARQAPNLPRAVKREAHPAVCRVYVDQDGSRGRERCVGTGVLIWRGATRAAVLTVGHLFRGRRANRRIHVVFPDGQRTEAEKITIDPKADLGLLTIPAPEGIEPIAIVQTPFPQPGDRITVCGYDGQSGKYLTTTGAARGYSQCQADDGSWTERFNLVVNAPIREGLSGGPMMDDSGDLVGIAWGTTDRLSYGTYCGRINLFLADDKSYFAPWNAKTEQTRIKADAGAYSPPPPQIVQQAPPLPQVAPAELIDGVARQLAQDALDRVARLEPTVAAIAADADAASEAAMKATDQATEATDKAKEAGEAKTGIMAQLGNLKKWIAGLAGGGVLGWIIALVAIFMVRKKAMLGAQAVDWMTDKTPWKWDDRMLDPRAYAAASWVSGKPVPPWANDPNYDAWGRPIPGYAPPQQPPQPPPQPPAPVPPQS